MNLNLPKWGTTGGQSEHNEGGMMPKHIPCPKCKGSIVVRKSGDLHSDDRTGLLARECLIECRACGRKGKMLVTLDVGLYLDKEQGLALDQTPFPTGTAA